jgi:4'-phosphopantetheinyl transferase
MPLIKTLSAEDAHIGIWLMEESSVELSEMISLSEKELLQMQKYSAEKRKKELLTVRLLLALATGEHYEIDYSQTGQPFIAGSCLHISISHSGNLAAIILSRKAAGIDVEVMGRKISNIASRFLSFEELRWTSQSEDPSLAQLYCWCCKESIYKMMGLKDLTFNKDILIAPLELKSEGVGSAVFRKEQIRTNIKIYYFTLENNLVTWCTINEDLLS